MIDEDFCMKLLNGDMAVRKKDMFLILFADTRRVLSTSAWNGGMQEDLSCVFNYDLSHEKSTFCEMLGSTMAEHMHRIGEVEGLPDSNAGLCTAAQIKNTAIAQEQWDGTTVTAFVTAGIDENGGRAGDTASWQEKDGQLGVSVGTVNIMLHFDCDLSEGALVGALLTATEAKTAAILELLLPSKASSGLATGSGTDGAILICDPHSSRHFTDSGKHSKLGEMIGRAVMTAVKEALFLQTGASAQRLHDALRLLGRFGVTENVLKQRFPERSLDEIHLMCQKEEVWIDAAVYAHLMDLENWGIITHKQRLDTVNRLFTVPDTVTIIVKTVASATVF